MEARDLVDQIREQLSELYPDLDTSVFGITGRILRLAHAIESRRAAHLAPIDLTPGDFDLLATLRRTDRGSGVNPGELLDSLLITSGGLTKRLDKLEARALLERQPDPSDRRATLVRLTPHGRDVIDSVLPELIEIEDEAAGSRLSPRQLEQASSLLRRLSVVHSA